jgi:hypothetical protein
MRRIKFLAAVLAIAAITAGAAYWHHRQQGGAATVASGTNNAAARALAKVRANANAPARARTIAHAPHALPAALQFQSPRDFRLDAHWFDALPPNADGKFPTSNTPLQFDASCAGAPEARYATFESAIAREIGFDPTQTAPADVLVQDIAQFWQLGGNFYKMSGRWERDQPATYRVNLFSSTNANFAEPLRVLPLPEGVAPQIDIVTLDAALNREVSRAIEAGGTRGARLVQVFYPSADNHETLEVKLHNGRPVSWAFGHGRCQRRSDGDAYCRCIPASSRELQVAGHNHNNQEEQHRVRD